MEKFGRNRPCWCGSGKKYIKCHYEQEAMGRPNLFNIEKQWLEISNKKYCLHPHASENKCKGDIVKAHTIQKKGGLTNIAEDGHVMALKPNMKTLIETDGKIIPELLGINKASTFTGFCEYHDNSAFELIEKYPIKNDKEHFFLLSYRAICFELYKKKAQLESINKIDRQLDMGKPLETQIERQNFMNGYEMYVKKSFEELSYIKEKFDKSLISKDYSEFSYYAVKLDKLPEVLCSGGFTPEFDFKGNILQDYENLQRDLESLYFSLIPFENTGLAVFGWIGDKDSACFQFIKSLHNLYSNGEIGNALVRFAFDSIENIFFRISWWNTLPKNAQDSLQNRILTGIIQREHDCLIDDDFRTVNWNALSTFSNLNI